MPTELEQAAAMLREFALGLPEAQEDFPWGERVAKVNKKVFAFFGKGIDADGCLGFGVKLPESAAEALEHPFAGPARYGMGKYGWVSVRFGPGERPPVELFLRWIEESYRAIAPKKLVAKLEGPWLNRKPESKKQTSPKRKKP